MMTRTTVEVFDPATGATTRGISGWHRLAADPDQAHPLLVIPGDPPVPSWWAGVDRWARWLGWAAATVALAYIMAVLLASAWCPA